MMVGLMGMAIFSGIAISKTGKYKMFPILGAVLTMARDALADHPTADTPIWVICVQLFVLRRRPGPIMQVDRPRGAELRAGGPDRHRHQHEQLLPRGRRRPRRGRLRLDLHHPAVRVPAKAFTGAGASAEQAVAVHPDAGPAGAEASSRQQLRDAIVNAYADSLAPVFWYLVPFLGVALSWL